MVGFAIHSHDSATGVHVFPILSPSLLPPHPIPQGHPSAPALSTLSHASNLDWQSVSHMIIHMFQSMLSNHPALTFTHRVQKTGAPQYSCLEKSHGHRSLASHIPWGCPESDSTEQLIAHTLIVRGGIIIVPDVSAGLASAFLAPVGQTPGCGLSVLRVGAPVISRPS